MCLKVKIVAKSNESDEKKATMHLLDIAKKCQGLSGRSLRKLPLLAHAWFVHHDLVDLHSFLDAMDDAVDKHCADNRAVEKRHELC